MHRTRFIGALALSIVLACVPWVMGWSTGAPSGVSGGPAGYAYFLDQSGTCAQCHDFNIGRGKVEILNAPRRYLSNMTYDLTVRISDPDQVAAGFEISAETPGVGHQGAFEMPSDGLTQYADFGSVPEYVTHQDTGVIDSEDSMGPNGDFYDYHITWRAPTVNEAQTPVPVTLFAAGNAVSGGAGSNGDHFYGTYKVVRHAVPGDWDGDEDLDLRDVAALQRCYNGDAAASGDGCAFLDIGALGRDGNVALDDLEVFVREITGPTATAPADYVAADAVRGGQLFDKWWPVNGAPEPTLIGEHPLYPAVGTQTDSTTFRCKECHGWDYKGVNGAYASPGTHYTGVIGVLDSTKTPQEMFDLLKAPTPDLPGGVANGHNMDAYGMSDQDIWDVVKMMKEALIDTDAYTNGTVFFGVPSTGEDLYANYCADCHGANGNAFPLGLPGDPETVGSIANDNPWEFLHKIRFGHPGSAMPWLVQLGAEEKDLRDLGAYCLGLSVTP